jgi:hypothetical protein
MKKGVYCVENMWSPSVKDKSSVKPILELMEKAGVCEHLYHKCATQEELEFMLKKWKTKTVQSKFPILYFAYHGTDGALQLKERNKVLTLDQLGVILADSCYGKVFFFASCETLNIDERHVQRFLNQTGAIAAIGYKVEVDWMLATAFELLVLNALQKDKFDSKGIEKVKNTILTEYGNIYSLLKFRMVINKKIHFPRKRK